TNIANVDTHHCFPIFSSELNEKRKNWRSPLLQIQAIAIERFSLEGARQWQLLDRLPPKPPFEIKHHEVAIVKVNNLPSSRFVKMEECELLNSRSC
ncbi:hypothetical protein SOVF_021420 isoform A, partial [Spinacia oleracea]